MSIRPNPLSVTKYLLRAITATLCLMMGGTSVSSVLGSSSGGAASMALSSGTAASVVSGKLWIMNSSSLKAFTSDPTDAQVINSGTIYEILSPLSHPTPEPNIIPVIKYEDSNLLLQALSSHTIPSWVKAVIYDPENWYLTPLAQRLNPLAAVKSISGPVHNAGLRLILTPGLDLAANISMPGLSYYQKFEATNILGQMAPYADVVELQTQSLEGEQAVMTQFIKTEVTAIHSANPSATVLSAVSTNDAGVTPTLTTLTQALVTSASLSSGTWFNIPSYGTACPSCGAFDPTLAVSSMQQAALTTTVVN